jgi:histidinol dehydrogenase
MLTRLDLRESLPPTETSERTQWLRHNLPRPQEADRPREEVRRIIDEVRSHGDAALQRFTKEFDGVDLDITDFRVPPVEVDAALRDVSPLLREALEQASESILAFHRSARPANAQYEREGIGIRSIWQPVDRAGCYVPGGLAQYPSSVLMMAIPARVAGVPQVALCVPPGPDGKVPQSVLAAAALAEVDEVYAVGGAQAIAAMAYGTETVVPVDIIVGPGNTYVSTAKREVATMGVVGVPSSYAGPSEVVVVADDTAPVEIAAIDLIVQAEHGPGGLAWLVTWSEEFAEQVEEAVASMVARSPRRSEIESTLGAGGYSVIVDGPESAMDVSNAIAPEHLQLMTVDPEALVGRVRHAGAVFIGPGSPASVGDYIAGPSHVLPVNGSARFASALGVDDFMRNQHVISVDESALTRVAPYVTAIAEAEGLDSHARSVWMRTRS